MLRINRLTDYSVLLLCHLSKGWTESETKSLSASELASLSGLPQTTVSKLLKSLAGHHLLESSRGTQGGYTLIKDPANISLLHVLEILEGPVALTDCVSGDEKNICELQGNCLSQNPWKYINEKIKKTLAALSLADLYNSSVIPCYLEQKIPQENSI